MFNKEFLPADLLKKEFINVWRLTIKFAALRKTTSPFNDYIEALPSLVPSISRWEDNTVNEIDSKNLYASMLLFKQINKSYQEWIKEVGLNIPYEDMLWAIDMASSRPLPKVGKLNNESGLIVCPLADYINHSFIPNVSWDIEKIRFNNKEEDHIVIYAIKDIEKNSQLYFNYGCSNNLHYLKKYGFTVSKITDVHYNIKNTPFEFNFNKNKEFKNKLLTKNKIDLDNGFVILKPQFSSNTLTMSRILSIDEASIINKGLHNLEIIDYTKPLVKEDEIKAINLLYEGISHSAKTLTRNYDLFAGKIPFNGNKDSYDLYNAYVMMNEEQQVYNNYLAHIKTIKIKY